MHTHKQRMKKYTRYSLLIFESQ